MASKPEKSASENYNAELEWIKFCEESAERYADESESKFARKIKENPFVPIGAMATVWALGYGLWCFRKGRSQQSQNMMRARIAAQGFTIVALLGGLVWGAGADSSKSDKKPS